MKLFLITILLTTSAFAQKRSCTPLYQEKINYHESQLNRLRRKGKGRSQKAIYHQSQRKSLIKVYQLLLETKSRMLKGTKTTELSKRVNINPQTVQNIVRRSNLRGYLCKNNNLMDFGEIAVGIRGRGLK